MSEEKFSKCGREKKNVILKFRVFGKKRELKEKVQIGKKKNQNVFRFEVKVKDFAKFVFTSWALCYKTWLKFEN